MTGTALAGTPSPDPPPLPTPDPAPVQPTQPASTATAPRVSAPPVAVTPVPPATARTAPAVRSTPSRTPVRTRRAAKPRLQPAPVRRAPHDRAPVPLATFVVEAKPLDDGLLVAAGVVLLFICVGGLVVLAAGRRLLGRAIA